MFIQSALMIIPADKVALGSGETKAKTGPAWPTRKTFHLRNGRPINQRAILIARASDDDRCCYLFDPDAFASCTQMHCSVDKAAKNAVVRKISRERALLLHNGPTARPFSFEAHLRCFIDGDFSFFVARRGFMMDAAPSSSRSNWLAIVRLVESDLIAASLSSLGFIAARSRARLRGVRSFRKVSISRCALKPRAAGVPLKRDRVSIGCVVLESCGDCLDEEAHVFLSLSFFFSMCDARGRRLSR